MCYVEVFFIDIYTLHLNVESKYNKSYTKVLTTKISTEKALNSITAENRLKDS